MDRPTRGDGGQLRGFFVAFGYSRDAEQQCAAFHKRTGPIIKLLPCRKSWTKNTYKM